MKGNKFAEGNGPNQTSFKKGSTPWNKGKHVSLSPATQFKKGQPSINHKPIGTNCVAAAILDKLGIKREEDGQTTTLNVQDTTHEYMAGIPARKARKQEGKA